jgi:hypothetical protein
VDGVTFVQIFDGIADALRHGNLLTVGSKIKQIPPAPIAAPANSRVIDGVGAS